MKRDLLFQAFGGIDERFVAEAYGPIPGDAAGAPEKVVPMYRKRFLTLAIAAALTLALGSTAYAGHILFGWGGNMEIRATQTDTGIETEVLVHTESLTEPVRFEDGRMYFVVNEEHIDITDRVSETEPYIYRFTDEQGVIHYWIVGKNGPEPERYGFAEYLHPSDGDWTAGYVARTDKNEAPWLYKAWEELGFDFSRDS